MILYRYVLKEYFRFATGTLVLCLFFFILFDFIQKAAGYLGKYNPSAQLLTQYYVLQLPFEIYQATPIAALIASITVMIILTRNGETTAMQAVGMSPIRIAAPLAIGGMILSLLAFSLSEWVIPYSARRAHYLKNVLMEGEDAGLSEGAYWIRTPKLTFNFKTYHPNTKSLERIKVLYLDPDHFNPRRILHAEKAFYSEKYNWWLLHNLIVADFDDQKRLVRSSRYPFRFMSLPVEPKKLNFDRRAPFELSLREISEITSTGLQASTDLLSYRIAWHMKFSYPLAAFLISFLGLRFGYRIERTTETLKAMLLALVIALSYWLILGVTKALAATGSLHPFAAGWLPNFWIAIIILWQFWQLHREHQ